MQPKACALNDASYQVLSVVWWSQAALVSKTDLLSCETPEGIQVQDKKVLPYLCLLYVTRPMKPHKSVLAFVLTEFGLPYAQSFRQ